MNTKVRIACRRCRSKRIKCDGGVPACGNCQKAGEPCIDVDGRNNAVSIPRDFAANARARIEWLEDQVRRLSPEFNIHDGPRVDFSFLGGMATATQQKGPSPSPEFSAPPTKRTFSSTIEPPPAEDTFADEARSVALDLGLLTLNSDSRQTHYLGTSSGRLFTSLIGVGSPETPTLTRGSRTPSLPSQTSPGKTGPIAHIRRVKESYRVLYDSLRRSLPLEEDARVLLEVYFRNIHIDHPFLHVESVVNAVEALYHCAASDVSADVGYNGWVDSLPPFTYNGEYEVFRGSNCTPVSIFTATFHVFMIFAIAATVRTRQKSFDFAPNQFYRVAMSAGQHCFSHTSMASLQATLLLAVYSLQGPAELNIWTLTYVAMAHCVDLGLHRTPSEDAKLSKAARLARSMAFFSVYHLDRSIAALQGRPLGIRDETFDLQLPTLEDVQLDAASIQDKAFAPEMSIAGGLAFALHRFKLDPIISEIKLLFYHLPSRVNAYVWPSDHSSSQASIRTKLDDWRRHTLAMAEKLVPEFEEDRLAYRNYELKLTSQYFAAMILLHQPSQAIPEPSQESLLTCYQCAAWRLNTYNDLYHADSYYQSWRSVQGIFSSGATMIYCLWTSTLVRATVPVTEAIKDLRTCTNLLSVGGEWWPSVKKGKESFGRAMDALLKRMDCSQQQGRGNQGFTQQTQRPHTLSHNPIDPATAEGPLVPPPANLDAVSTFEAAHTTIHDDDLNMNQFSHSTGDFPTTEWTMLDNHAFSNNTHHFSELFFDANIGAPDSTVDAFIAEFMNEDTAWNPF
ncbi:hypothetical protein BU24DRAFT_282921 [Aaosphaeria arxii CBS 175.79]|uniref:Zn(2)-C6 fungal-type domain-containing protein n=1 Tax=Aaosphaeria arxii CBS 175.79 TaxID=1450172 RepID=A0A6A5XFB9_9PLEO|nr:uncharacterized protein BU24DRAFT_282921 [Aaosphaeria arxii CBS 175.79]KAF2011517.1 hypothetical protein BU24DRAFT_282921 [Aaosphaeria arxii CBS 175.79]